MNTSEDILISISDNRIKTENFSDDDIVAYCNMSILNDIVHNVDYEDNMIDIIRTICKYPTIFTLYRDLRESNFIIYDKYSISRTFYECDNKSLMSYNYIKYITNNIYCSVDKIKDVLDVHTNISYIQHQNEIIDTFFINNNEYININNLYNIFDKNPTVRFCTNYNKVRHMLDKELNDIDRTLTHDMKMFKEIMMKKDISEVYDKEGELLCDHIIDMFNNKYKYKSNMEMILDVFNSFNTSVLSETVISEISTFKDIISSYPFVELFDEIRICVKRRQNKDIHYLSIKTSNIEELYNRHNFKFKYSCLSDVQKEELHSHILKLFPLSDETLNKISSHLYQDDIIIFSKDFFSLNNTVKYSYLWIINKIEEIENQTSKSFLSMFVFW